MDLSTHQLDTRLVAGELHGGYISSALLDALIASKWDTNFAILEVLKNHSHFAIAPAMKHEEDPDPLTVLLANLIQRGLPTLPSLRIEQELATRTGLIQVESTGATTDTRAWKVSLADTIEVLSPSLERALLHNNLLFEPGPAPLFTSDFGTIPEEDAFYNNQLRRALGPVWSLVERRRPVSTLIAERQYSHLSVDFCVEFIGVIGVQPRGVIFHFDGHLKTNPDAKATTTMLDSACSKAGWVVIHVSANDPDSLFEKPGLKVLYQHPRYKYLSLVSDTESADDKIQDIQSRNLIWLPLAVARIQMVVVQAVLSGWMKLDDPAWHICIIERDLVCAEIALEDLRAWLVAVMGLYAPERSAPEIQPTIVREEMPESVDAALRMGVARPFQMVVDFACLSSFTASSTSLPAIPCKHRVSVRSSLRPRRERSLYSSTKALPTLPDEPLSEPAANALIFFLNNMFRKGNFREKQRDIVSRALRRQPTIALLPTGAGKSLTYQLSALLTNGIALIVAPLVSLMKDQVDNLAALGIDCTAYINSSLSSVGKRNRQKQMVDGRLKFVFVSPERLQIQAFRDDLSRMSRVRFCFGVVDEAHCVSEWGHDFRTAYLKLGENLGLYCPPDTKGTSLPVIALTGTASDDVLKDVQRELGLLDHPAGLIKPSSMARKELNFRVLPLSDVRGYRKSWNKWDVGTARLDLLVVALNQVAEHCEINGSSGRSFQSFIDPSNVEHGTGLIFCPHVEGVHGINIVAEKLGKVFSARADQIGKYAGKLRAEEGDESLEITQNQFKQGSKTLLACTSAFGMGIDKANIRFTIHLNIPKSVEAFYQEAGRAGRDRQTSYCLVLYSGCVLSTGVSVDQELMLSFHQAAFPDKQLEVDRLFELLEHLRSTPVKNIKRQIRDHCAGSVYELRGEVWQKHGLQRIYVNDQATGETMGYFLPHDMKFKPETKIGEDLRTFIKALRARLLAACPEDTDLLWWLEQPCGEVESIGIEERLLKMDIGETDTVEIPFENAEVDSLLSKLNEEISDCTITRTNIHKALEYAASSDDFLNALERIYKRRTGTTFTAHAAGTIGEAFRLIRVESSTYKAVYRLAILGMVKDFTVDYHNEIVRAEIIRLPEGAYTENLKKYISRYYCNRSNWVDAGIKNAGESSELKNAAKVLLDFVYDTIAAKRKSSIETMDQFASIGINNPGAFRTRLESYFDSRYTEDLREDSQDDRVEWADRIWHKFVDMSIDSLNHMLGSVNRLIDDNPYSSTLRLLRAVTMAVLGEEGLDVVHREALEAMHHGSLSEENSRAKTLSVLSRFVSIVEEYDPARVVPFELIIAKIHLDWCNEFLADFE